MSIYSRSLVPGAFLVSVSFLLTSCGGGGGSGGGSGGGGATALSPPPAPTISLASNATAVAAGSPVTLTWSTTGATSCTASGGWTGPRGTSGSEASANLKQQTTFTLSCTGAGGNATAQVTVGIAAGLPVVTISATPSDTAVGSRAQLSWSTTDAVTCTASGGWSGLRPTQGLEDTPVLAAHTTFRLACVGPGGTSFSEVTVRAFRPVKASLSIRPITAAIGDYARLSWVAADADSCEASGAWDGALALEGTALTEPLPAGTTTYTMVCTNPLGSATSTASITTEDPIKLADFVFVEQTTATHSTDDLLPISGEPLVGKYIAQATLMGPAETATFEVVDVSDDGLLSTAALTLQPATDETPAYWQGLVDVPAAQFYIRVRGKRTGGGSFELVDERIYSPAAIRVTFSPQGPSLQTAVETPVEVLVENPNAEAVDVMVACSGEEPLAISPQNAELSVPANGSAPLTFLVTPAPPIELLYATPRLTCAAIGLTGPSIGAVNESSIVLPIDDVLSAEIVP